MNFNSNTVADNIIYNPDSSPVAVVMGSQSDFSVMKQAIKMLEDLEVGCNHMIVSAHRTPERLFDFAKNAKKNKYRVIIAGAGGSAHLPGMIASLTTLPVLGVPICATPLNGIDSALSILQMPAGVPVATFAISSSGDTKSPGAINAAIFAAQLLALHNEALEKRLNSWMETYKDIPLRALES